MIDWFMGGKHKKKSKDPLFDLMNPKTKKKKDKNPLAGLMIKPNKAPIIGDRITKSQRKALRTNPFGDWDGDRVINGLDCSPRNPKKHNYSWKPMPYKEQKRMRDEAIERHYQEKGYYKYGGPEPIQSEDLQKGTNIFSENPIKKFVRMSSQTRNYIPINNDYITPQQNQVLKSGQDRFTDTDKDGVIDGLDCQPKDPTRHMAFKETSGVPIIDYPDNYGYSRKKVMMTPKMFMREARASNLAFDMTDEEYEKNTVTNYRFPEERDKAVNERGVNPKELDEYIEHRKDYMGKLKSAIQDKEPKVPMGYIEYDERGYPKEHEGRHRAIAARDAGMKELPVYIVNKTKDKDGNPKTYYGPNPKDSNNYGD